MAYEYAGDRDHIEEPEEVKEEVKVSMETERGVLLSAGICMRVPFSRVYIKQTSDLTKDYTDFAGVSMPSLIFLTFLELV